MIDRIIEQIEMFHIARKATANEMRTTFKNREIPLADRWRLFEACGKEILEIHPWGEPMREVEQALGVAIRHNMEYDRYRTILFTSVIEEIQEAQYEMNAEPLESYWEWARDIRIDHLKEAILDAGYAGFENDW